MSVEPTMYEWPDTDLCDVSEHDFPIRCAECSHSLSALGDSGLCPHCGLKFDRRRRLLETFGPEAFADPPIPEQDEETPLVGAIVFGLLVSIALVPFFAWISRVVLGLAGLQFVFFTWLLLTGAMIWIMTVRCIERNAAPDTSSNNSAIDGTAGGK